MTDVDPFDEGVPRNGRGDPQIIPLKRGKPDLKAKLATYTRASTFAKALDNGAGLTTWKVRHAVIGVATSPNLAAMIGALGVDLNDYTPDDKRNLDTIIERAHDRSGGNMKADYGTAIHSLTEDPFDSDDARDRYSDEQMRADVDAYNRALTEAGLEVVSAEQFVVNDELATAGTFDHVYRTTLELTVGDATIPAGTLLIGDKKTGALHFGQNAIQLAVYARGSEYDHTTGERTALDVSPQWGIVAHIPKGKASAGLYLIDLHAGWEAAKLALKVRTYRSASNERRLATDLVRVTGPSMLTTAAVAEPVDPLTAPAVHEGGSVTPAVLEWVQTDHPNIEVALPVASATAAIDVDEFGDPLLDAIRTADNNETCRVLWAATPRGEWQQHHTDAVKARIAELDAAA